MSSRGNTLAKKRVNALMRSTCAHIVWALAGNPNRAARGKTITNNVDQHYNSRQWKRDDAMLRAIAN